ncbi:MAG: hypothetical protein K2M91_04145 [Lachnospiraceae bacterium]|nr:hypothetical protein [Lachnospiraceae bacterium]
MKDYFDRTLNRMQGDTITDEKNNYYQGVIDSYFELGFLSEYERGELAIHLIDLHCQFGRIACPFNDAMRGWGTPRKFRKMRTKRNL